MSGMRALFLCALTLLTPAIALAVESHRADIGDNCRHAAEIEANLGKKPTYDVERMLQRNLLLFEGASESGGSEQTLYRCSDTNGTVIGYSTKISLPSEPLAWDAYARAKAAMQARFGPPPINSETFALPQRIRLWRAYSSIFSTNEFAQWENVPGQSVSVKLQKLRDSAQWEVVTTDMPALGSAAEEPRDRLLRLLARALVVAVSSAAAVAALAMTRLHPFRWLIALTVPLALALELHWALPWNPASAAEASTWDLLALAACFVLGAMASSLVIWRLAGQLAPREAPAPAQKRAAKPLLISGLVLFAVLVAWLWWQFRPGNDPGNLAGGFALKLLLPPLVLLISTALTVLGTVRLPSVTAPTAPSAPAPDLAFAVVGVLASVVGITLCVTLAAEIALSL